MKYVLFSLLLLGSLHAHAALNKWVDADGKVHYSDSPPADAKVQKIRSSETPDSAIPASVESAPKSLAEREAEWKKSQQSKAEAEQKEAKKKQEDENKQKNCEAARSNLATLENSPALVTYNAKGERTYIDDAGRAQRIEEARKAIANFCN